ncbi:MAG: extracellular solute-binding protein, partial [Clostridiales bacterium]|nr:extracellular solute-binding protein [Clostridiales bacterium]
GSDIIKDQRLNIHDPGYKKVWDFYYNSAVKGGMAIYDGWGNYLAATGDIVCATASSAGATYYPSRITYADNTKEDVEFDVLPYPVFQGGENVVFQRGGGICVVGGDPAKGYAASLFLRWFTEADRNLLFCVGAGYMPVREAAFDGIMEGGYPAIENPIAEKSLLATTEMQKGYRFYFPPVFDGFETLQTQYAERLRRAAQDGRDNYLRLLKEGGQAPGNQTPESQTPESQTPESQAPEGQEPATEDPASVVQGPGNGPDQAKYPDTDFDAASKDAMESFIERFDP